MRGSKTQAVEERRRGKRRRGHGIEEEEKKETATVVCVAVQFTLFWPIMFYSTITNSRVVSDLISQLISLSNVNTKTRVEPLPKSSHLYLLPMHNLLP